MAWVGDSILKVGAGFCFLLFCALEKDLFKASMISMNNYIKSTTNDNLQSFSFTD